MKVGPTMKDTRMEGYTERDSFLISIINISMGQLATSSIDV